MTENKSIIFLDSVVPTDGTMYYISAMEAKTKRNNLTLDLSGGFREHLEKQAGKESLSLSVYIKAKLKKATKFKG